MRHHKHPGIAGRLDPARPGQLIPHPDTERADARLAWLPIASADGREVDALEGVTCVPTREGAMRIVAVPHAAAGLTLGDEVAVADWEGEPLARGELGLALAGTVRCVAGDGRSWLELAQLIDEVVGSIGACWFDAIGDHAVAASVPRRALVDVFACLEEQASAGASDQLRWEYATPDRH